jgi:hypothetical protein
LILYADVEPGNRAAHCTVPARCASASRHGSLLAPAFAEICAPELVRLPVNRPRPFSPELLAKALG